MDRDRKGRLHYIRYTLTVIGTLMLIAALFMLAMISGKDDSEYMISEPTKVDHRVLFLCAYNPLYFTYEAQTEGLKEGLYPNGIEYDVVFMDTKNYGTYGDTLHFYTFLKERLKKNRGYEAVLLGDDDALLFALEHQEELFKDYPMVYFGINDIDLAKTAAKNPMMTGFYEKDYLKECIETAIATLPDRKTFVALHDDSAAGREDEDIFYSYDQKYPDHKFIDINTSKITEKQLIEALEELPEDSVLFYMTCYLDVEGKTYSVLDRTNTVVTYAKVPIFRNYSGGRDQGVLGGTYMDFKAQCREAAQIIYEVLSEDADISQYPLDVDTPSVTSYNYKLMQKYGIDEKLLPDDTQYIDKPVSIIGYYSDIIPVAVLIITALLMFILTSNLAVEQQKQANAEIKKSKEDLEKSQKQLIYAAEHDELLDILNRKSIVATLNLKLKPSDMYSILMVDLDGFKTINENYGHAISDDILKHLAAELKRLEQNYHWLVGRYGGDEFIIMVPGTSLNEKSLEINDLLEFFRQPMTIGTETIQLSASIGIANSDGVSSPEQHIINAEIAMYESKERGKDMASVFTESMQLKMRDENRIKAVILEAFENEAFYMVYQPKIDTRTKMLLGFEALVRIKNYDMPPAEFIPVIEKNGLVARLGRITTKIVVEQLALWKRQGKELVPVSINFSTKQINDHTYPAYLKELLEKNDIPSKYVQLEMTESLFLEKNHQTMKLFDKVKDLNIRLLLDDFGTGYSSLGYLTYVPIDEIKLDKSLVDAFLVEGKDSFIKDVILLAHDLNKTIVIEGVEEKWQYERLLEFEADAIQGYYFSKPLSASIAIDFKVQDN
ncbi:MAG: bifunctional diguanylate cyclase/phosphodiesterase [Butyrivibrio sp.]|nr:bifunctional diguanylate cyclase/phosphodiesterase [Butyrivibrio sp.]